jgi:hypothetical protein
MKLNNSIVNSWDLISESCFIASNHEFQVAVGNMALKQHCQCLCGTCWPEICVLSESPGMLAGLILAILSTPLCLLPQHGLSCFNGKEMLVAITASAQVWTRTVLSASLRLVSIPSHQGSGATCRSQWPSVSAWLLQQNFNLQVWHR